MKISYKKLWVMLIEREIPKSTLRKDIELSPGTMSKLNKNEDVALSVLLRGEKVDIVRYSDDPAEFSREALSPAEVISVELDGERSARVTVYPDQLSLAIGKEGQNARLAARLTGYKIDIKA